MKPLYLNIGGGTVLHCDDIIGIFDMDNTTTSKHTKEFLNRVQRCDAVESTAYDIPVSFVVTANGDNERVYLSQYAPRTLRSRIII
ncbi:MAG: DUF370 domain-containing protein [Ruminococcaceae bacterium]|nr:DUF370 domain-containing protein [Oscillospiraceae bacterium]